ncbi:LysR family transcriptional regulator [Azospirillum thiophilum]|uniref:LysR family transcriptional regulator n=1 Tax=Azospirillum thiophilum TaxID=528244 RepID=A0AAC8W4X0_9PROT|nr:LysR family transcriptional regulator [Azospirillum thiophilum]ALG75244.1 LysR family transcriptional regulator [Azospirillum thiophilum]KJR62637.1 LysR family transcriptional regulator [Azospirillum thiophilum]
METTGLSELEAVHAVARHRGFRAAAVELGVSRSALSHAVAALEARLGVRLFHRTTRSVAPTQAGERFVADTAPALRDIRAALDRLAGQRATPSGTLRINSSAGAARMIMQPVVLEFLRRYPEMTVDIVTEGRLVDIVLEGFDAGVRLAELVPQDMIAVPLGPELRFAVVGSPGYFADSFIPTTPADLARHRCIRSRMPGGSLYRWEFERHGEAVAIDGAGPLILDDSLLMLDAARAGIGLAYVTEWQVAEDLAAGRLVRVLEEWTPPFPGLCLYYSGRRHLPTGLRALVDLVREIGAKAGI